MAGALITRLGSATFTMISYMRTPFLASSGIAVLLSGLLYAKQKYLSSSSHLISSDPELHQSEIIYPRNLPSGARSTVPTPGDFGHDDYEDLRIPTPDGETLSAYLIKPRNASRRQNVTILMFHGNAGNIGHRVPIGLKLQEDNGCNVLMLEYRGYGASTGRPDERGLMIDGQAGLRYLRDRPDMKGAKIVVYGQSLGGALAIQLVASNQGGAGDEGIAGLILENTFTSIRKLIPSAFPPARFLAGLCHQIWPSESILPTITDVPILFLSGLQDEIVPASHMVELYRLCRSKRKRWRTFANGMHNDTVIQPGYFDYVAQFLRQEVMNASSAPS
ncbi:MAG: hypothetical protein M1816_007329 [Peltula sp. TS41687]|nr:MAG: hypothetical protein M1816_007329 [Peltula sp. TS41687]